MRPLTPVTFLAIFSVVNLHLCAASSRFLFAEGPAGLRNNVQSAGPAAAPGPENHAGVLEHIPASLPANKYGSLPVNVPPDILAKIPPELKAKLPPNVSPDMLANLPPETLANIEASKGQLQTSEILATLPEMQGQIPANVPPELLAKLPQLQSQLPANITPEMVVSLAAMQHPGAPGNAAAGVISGDIPQIPKMPDFSGLADISFPPMPSGPKMPRLPHDISLFGYEVKIPKFISNMVGGDGDGDGKS
ncbi:hypothetical protein HU200_028051 [Digitaria exilis]|uniref:Uncharacterized protein n=1 Tax=Digitaria exilis TaxID=1010633 RepID=A0A835EQG7_9POAL|nr:hypothetical protein HU200_028051 [Digitaria exilis]CAB3504219.1 unnamed protein product [Digitaria exilis]